MRVQNINQIGDYTNVIPVSKVDALNENVMVCEVFSSTSISCNAKKYELEMNNHKTKIQELEDKLKEAEQKSQMQDIQIKAYEESILFMQPTHQIGLLSYALVHEIKNRIMSLSGCKDLFELSEEPKNKERASEYRKKGLELLANGVNDIKETTQSLLNYARNPKSESSYMDMKEVINRQLDFHTRAHPHRTWVKEYLNTNKVIMPYFGNPLVTSFVLDNIIQNAVDATNQSTGKIIIDIKQKEIFNNGKYTIVSVEDNGNGIAQDDYSLLFTPGFTKGKPNGTGNGLWLSYQFLEKTGGEIDFESEVGLGTKFSLYFKHNDIKYN